MESYIHYLHHFGIKDFKPNKIDPSKEFSLLFGSLFSMLGLATYMGFSKFYLIGMDYLYSNPKNGHFYEYGKRPLNNKVSDIYAEKPLLAINEYVNLRTVTINDDFKGDLVEAISYRALMGRKLNYKENNEIIETSELLALDKPNMNYRIFSE